MRIAFAFWCKGYASSWRKSVLKREAYAERGCTRAEGVGLAERSEPRSGRKSLRGAHFANRRSFKDDVLSVDIVVTHNFYRETMLPAEYLAMLKEWNRLAGSKANSTIVVRRRGI